jgi:sugar/nucleoside kinase (ribokinase family)
MEWVAAGDPETFAGPFPSGAPAIFAYSAARLGAETRFIGVIGQDAAGRACREKLAGAGIDLSYLQRDVAHATGSVLVRYQRDGSRRYDFHLADSAAACLSPPAPDAFAGVSWLHLSGSSLLISPSLVEACTRAVELAQHSGATTAFDPNIRLELADPPTIRQRCAPFIKAADIIFAEAEEASLLTRADDLETACRLLLAQGPDVIVLKLGARGCWVVTEETLLTAPPWEVEEVDPTGAGDCFAAGFTVARLEGQPLDACARFANLVGALSVTRRGPLEGAPSREDIVSYLRVHPL